MTKTGYLLTNTGSPCSCRVEDVREYLETFLTDPAVMGMPYLLRQLLVRGVIAPTRAPKSAERYRQIWLPEGAPLKVYSRQLADEIERLSGAPAYVAMRYEEGSVERALRQAEADGVTELISQPLYPHFASSSFGTVQDFVRRTYDRLRLGYQLIERGPFYDHPLFIRSLAEQIASAELPADTHLIFSFHGIPLSQVKPYAGDPERDYPYQCRRTMELLQEQPEVRRLRSCELVYQSRFGHRWLAPELIKRLAALPTEGTKSVAVICPSFVADCLESLEEVGLQGRELFLRSGGDRLTLVSCPNGSSTLARALL